MMGEGRGFERRCAKHGNPEPCVLCAEIRERVERTAKLLDQDVDKHGRYLLSKVGVSPEQWRGKRVLDIASTGETVQVLRAAGVEAYGANPNILTPLQELSPGYEVTKARDRGVPERKIHVGREAISDDLRDVPGLAELSSKRGVIRGDGAALPFKDHSMDEIISTHAGFVIKRPEVIEEIRRVLKPGGEFRANNVLNTDQVKDLKGKKMRKAWREGDAFIDKTPEALAQERTQVLALFRSVLGPDWSIRFESKPENHEEILIAVAPQTAP